MSDSNPPESNTQPEPQNDVVKTGAASKPTSPKSTTASEAPKSQRSKAGIVSMLVAGIALVLAALVGAATFFVWQQHQATESTQTQLQITLAEQSKNLQSLKDNNLALSNSLQTFEQSFRQELEERGIQLKGLANELTAIKGSTRKDWLLAEAEYLMRIANQRLAIEKDPSASQSLLEAADDVLAELKDPALMPVRIKLAEELLQLRAQSKQAQDTLLLDLSALSNIIATLDLSDPSAPVTPTKQAADNTVNTEAQSADQTEAKSELSIWQRISSYLNRAFDKAVHIRRLDEDYHAPPSPEFAEYIKQSLNLRIEQAKLLLLQRKSKAFKALLLDTVAWLSSHHANQNTQYKVLSNELQRIADIELNEQSIDISGSLTLLREKIELKYRDHSLQQTLKPTDRSNVDELSSENVK